MEDLKLRNEEKEELLKKWKNGANIWNENNRARNKESIKWCIWEHTNPNTDTEKRNLGTDRPKKTRIHIVESTIVVDRENKRENDRLETNIDSENTKKSLEIKTYGQEINSEDSNLIKFKRNTKQN